MNMVPALVAQLIAAVTQQLGWSYPPDRPDDLLRGVGAAARELGFASTDEFVRELVARPISARHLDALTRHLTIGETYFWREPQSLNLFRTQVLPALLATPRSPGQPLRIWSAGCSTGEEAYSLAILICESLTEAERAHISILATDINPVSLQKARQGIYGQWSFRATPAWLKSRYFHEQPGGLYQVAPELKRMVSFSALNLAEPAYPAPWGMPHSMGAIWCRNVLIYFEAQQSAQVMSRFTAALEVGGALIVAPCEIPRVNLSELMPVRFPEMTFFQKRAASQVAFAQPTPAAPRPTTATWGAPPVPERPKVGLPTIPTRTISPPPPRAAQAFSRPIQTNTPSPVPASTLEKAIDAARGEANAGRLDAALHLAEQAVAAHKMEPRVHYLLATIQQERGQLEAARQALRKTLYLDHAFVLAYLGLANLARQQGRTQEAEANLTATRSLLHRFQPDDLLPEGDGMTAGQLAMLVSNLQKGSE